MTHPPCKIELERALRDWVATRVAVILVGFAASGYLSTAFVRIEAVPLKPVALIRDPGLYRESVTNGEHRRVVNYDVSTLDAQFAKKVTASRCPRPAGIGVLTLSTQYTGRKSKMVDISDKSGQEWDEVSQFRFEITPAL
ncbi:MAG TPA: hypothetical protein VJ781_09775 [Pyrinomonadaceae bacterium]|nr:hypothetical protein [Pyrinomonadaceae bacterium]